MNEIQCNNIFIQTSQKLERNNDYIGKSYLKCWFLEYSKIIEIENDNF